MFHRRWLNDRSFSVGLEILVDLGGNSVHVRSSLLGKGLSNDEILSIFIFIGDLSNEGCSL